MATFATSSKTRGGGKTLHTANELRALLVEQDQANPALRHLEPTLGDEVMITDIDNGADFTFRNILGLIDDGVNVVVQTAASAIGAFVRSTFKQLPIVIDAIYPMQELEPEQPLTVTLTDAGKFVVGSLYGVTFSNAGLDGVLQVEGVRAVSSDALAIAIRNNGSVAIPATDLKVNVFLVANYLPQLEAEIDGATAGATSVDVYANEGGADVTVESN